MSRRAVVWLIPILLTLHNAEEAIALWTGPPHGGPGQRPFVLYCYTRAGREQWVGSTALRATLPAALVLHGPVLLAGLWLATILN